MIAHLFRVVQSVLRERKKEKTRSPRWPIARDACLKIHRNCCACGSVKRLQVHHVEPFHLRPELELDLANLMVLCMGPNECHFRIGHGSDFKAFNPHVAKHAGTALICPRERGVVEHMAMLSRRYEDEAPKK